MNPKCKSYKNYGGRGITICEEWMDIKNFIRWADPLRQKGLQIDRIDNNKGYSPGNCRFVTNKENIDNRRLLRADNTSGYRGVSYSIKEKKWETRIIINGKQKYLGCFNSPGEAAIVYDAAVPDNRTKNFK